MLGAIRSELSPPQRQILVHSTISGMHSVLRFRSALAEDELAAYLEEVARHTLGLDRDIDGPAEPPATGGPSTEPGPTPVAS